jgi:RimJ/RimL family protein N-acetyltransferase/acyl carrier protein
MRMQSQTDLRGRFVQLRPPMASDYDWLYRLSTNPSLTIGWRLRGVVPSPDQFLSLLWSDSEVQFIIEAVDSNMRAGLIQMYRLNLRDGFAYLGVVLEPGLQKQGWPLESIAMFLDYTLDGWPIRKFYLESSDKALAEYSSALKSLLCEEGRLQRHAFYGGAYHDLVISALYRDTWLASREALFARIPAAPTDPSLVGFRDFVEVVKERLLRDDTKWLEIAGGTLLQEDLGLDSLDVVVALGAIEDLAGAQDSRISPPRLDTFQDLYSHYEHLRARVGMS